MIQITKVEIELGIKINRNFIEINITDWLDKTKPCQK